MGRRFNNAYTEDYWTVYMRKNEECDERKDTLNFRNTCSGDTEIVNNKFSTYTVVVTFVLSYILWNREEFSCNMFG